MSVLVLLHAEFQSLARAGGGAPGGGHAGAAGGGRAAPGAGHAARRRQRGARQGAEQPCHPPGLFRGVHDRSTCQPSAELVGHAVLTRLNCHAQARSGCVVSSSGFTCRLPARGPLGLAMGCVLQPEHVMMACMPGAVTDSVPASLFPSGRSTSEQWLLQDSCCAHSKVQVCHSLSPLETEYMYPNKPAYHDSL